MGQPDQTTLLVDRGRGLGEGHAGRDGALEKEPQQVAAGRAHLLADDHGHLGRSQIAGTLRAVDALVIGDRKMRQAEALRVANQVGRLAERVERRRAVAVQVDERASRRGIHAAQMRWTSDFLKKSKCSSARPVPSATQFSEFSATWQGTPVTWVRSLSMLRSSEPPPDITMPLSMMSLDSSGRRLLEHGADGRDDLLERLLEGLHDLRAGQRDRARQAGDEVPAADLHVQLALQRQGRADRDLDLFGGALADHQVVLLADVGGDRLVEAIAADAQRRDTTIPPSEITAISLVPPPMSMMRLPDGPLMGTFAPMAAASGSSMR